MALQQKGHHAIRWFVADFPNKQRASIELANEVSTRISVSGSEFEEKFNDIDVVWFRRPTLPTAPTHIHEDDIAHTVFENSVFFTLSGLYYLMRLFGLIPLLHVG